MFITNLQLKKVANVYNKSSCSSRKYLLSSLSNTVSCCYYHNVTVIKNLQAVELKESQFESGKCLQTGQSQRISSLTANTKLKDNKNNQKLVEFSLLQKAVLIFCSKIENS